MAKKKRTQLKPVARGFATTSVPKKVVQAVEAEASTSDTSQPEVLEDVVASTSGDTLQSQTEEYDPDKHEEMSLQLLVDKFQDKIEKEVVRTIKVCLIQIMLAGPGYR